jgi:glucose uptake protein GlcU
MKNNLKETIVTISMIAIAILLLNPFHFWMPDMMVIGMLACALALFGVFASFVLREQSIDEREEQHKSLAGRNAYLAGSGILMLGIVAQGYAHSVDPWLVIALIGMVVVKLVTRHWSDKNR